MSDQTLSNLSREDRRFEPPADLAADANVKEEAYARADADREAFWADAADRLDWGQKWDQVLDWSNPPFAKWFVGGTLNASVNCVDRHVDAGNGDKVALHWVGEPDDDTRDITYAQLKDEVSKAANALTELGVQKGDRVAIYMPMIPEVVVAMLACARLGAPHTVVFGGFSADALASRITDCEAHVVITSDGGYRRGAAERAQAGGRRGRRARPATWCATCSSYDARARTSTGTRAATCGGTTPSTAPRPTTSPRCTTPSTRSTSCTPPARPASPRASCTPPAATSPVRRSRTGRSSTSSPTTDVYWCTADVGWVTGHSYMVYGPLANGATQVMYEGTPEKGRWWQIVQDYKVTIFYTAPTAIRTFMKQGREIPDGYDMSSLRLLGSVGEPINPEAYIWYREVIGGDRCPVVDTWWQTETGQIMISPLPGVTAGKPGSAMKALPGIAADVVDDDAKSVGNGNGGYLVLKEPWPAMLRTLWGDDQRFKDTYWSRWEGLYFAGDGAKLDEDGDIWLLGRVDDVMNVSGHRLSTTEIESALVSHPKVAEAAVVGAADETTGQAVCAFVILRDSAGDGGEDIVEELRKHVQKEIGAIAKPRQIMVVPELPKTRSGKIMRRLLKDVAEHREVGDVTTLADSTVMDLIKDKEGSAAAED